MKNEQKVCCPIHLVQLPKLNTVVDDIAAVNTNCNTGCLLDSEYGLCMQTLGLTSITALVCSPRQGRSRVASRLRTAQGRLFRTDAALLKARHGPSISLNS